MVRRNERGHGPGAIFDGAVDAAKEASGLIQTRRVGPDGIPGAAGGFAIWSTNYQDDIFAATQSGSVSKQFLGPAAKARGIGINSDGSYWIADGHTNVLYKTDQDGSVVNKLSINQSPAGVGVDSQDSVWISDPRSLYKFNEGGKKVKEIDGRSGADGLGIASDDSIWLADDIDDDIYRMDNTGSVIEYISNPLTYAPKGLDIDSNDSIWVAGQASNSIYELNTSGSILSSFYVYDNTIVGVGVNNSDSIIYPRVDAGYIYETADYAGSIQQSFQTSSNSPRGLGRDPNGSLWHADGASIYQTTEGGSVISSINPGGDAYAQGGVGVDSNGCIWHQGLQGEIALIFQLDQDGSAISSFSTDHFNFYGIGFNSDDSLWNSNGSNPFSSGTTLLKYDQSGSLVESIYQDKDGVTGIGVGGDDSVWLASTQYDSFYQIDPSTEAWTDKISTPQEFPWGVDVTGTPSAHATTWEPDQTEQRGIAATLSPSKISGAQFTENIWTADATSDSFYETTREASLYRSYATPSSEPKGVDIDSSGYVWTVTDTDSVYKITQADFTTYKSFAHPSDTPEGLGTGGPDDCIWVTQGGAVGTDTIYDMTQDGSVVQSFNAPSGNMTDIGVNPCTGSLWLTDDASASVYEMNQSGSTLSSFAAPSNNPYGIGVDLDECLWVAQDTPDDNSVYQMTTAGSTVTSFGLTTGDVETLGTEKQTTRQFRNSMWHATGGSILRQTLHPSTVNEDEFAAPFSTARGLDVTKDSSIWFYGDTSMYEYAPGGSGISSFDPGTTYNLWGVGIDTNGCIWSSAPRSGANGSMYQFTTAGSTVTSFAVTGPSYMTDVTVDSENSLWVGDKQGSVYELDTTGSITKSYNTVAYIGGLADTYDDCLYFVNPTTGYGYAYDETWTFHSFWSDFPPGSAFGTGIGGGVGPEV